jgi:hypothetical protein
VFDDIGRRIEFDRVLDAIADRDPRRAAWRALEESTAGWARDPQVIGRIVGLASADPTLATLVKEHERGRRKPIRSLVRRLRDAAALRPGINEAEAYAVLTMLTSFTTYDLLVGAGVRGTSLKAALRRLAGAVVDFQNVEETR